MTAKSLTAVALLAFVVISVVVLVRRESLEPTVSPAGAAAEPLPDDVLVAYYFHGDVRCPTCRNIEDYSHAAVETDFAAELAAGKLLWKVVNYEEPTNTHFATEYEIVAPTVVLVRRVAGKEAEWRNLTRVWELIGEREEFMGYVQRETRSMLGS